MKFDKNGGYFVKKNSIRQIKSSLRQQFIEMSNDEIVEWFKKEGCKAKLKGNVVELSHVEWGLEFRLFFDKDTQKYLISTSGVLEKSEIMLDKELFIKTCEIFVAH